MNELFLNQKINAAFPYEYFLPEGVEPLIEQYGEVLNDAANQVKTLYARQDTEDPDSRRAAGTSNESPQQLTNGKLLVVNVYPTIKVYEAVLNEELANVDIISNEDLESYIEEFKLPDLD